MCFVNNKKGSVLLFQSNKPEKVCKIPVHTEHGFSNNKNLAVPARCRCKKLFEMILVPVTITLIGSFSNFHSVNNARMVQPVT